MEKTITYDFKLRVKFEIYVGTTTLKNIHI